VIYAIFICSYLAGAPTGDCERAIGTDVFSSAAACEAGLRRATGTYSPGPHGDYLRWQCFSKPAPPSWSPVR